MRRSPIISLFTSLLVAALVLGTAACAEGDLDTYDDPDDPQENQNDDKNDPDNQDENDPDNQNQEKPQVELTEIHQWCAAAGESDDGELTALHCSGPHDTSGFEAHDGDHRWQPGAFHVVVE